MARTCALCGEDGLTKEHLFAKWIRDAYRSHAASGVMELQRNNSSVWSYGGNTLEHTVKAYCGKCNNGWMSDLEVLAGNILRPMIRAETVGIKMRSTAQSYVASWAVKTAMVLHSLHLSDSFIPTSKYRDFYKKRQPSADVFVMMGARHIGGNSKGANIFEYKEQFVGVDSVGIQHFHFAIGALYFGIVMFVGHERRFFLKMTNEEAGKRALLIWPPRPEVIWPSETISDIGGVEGMFEAFTRAYW